MNTVVQNKSFTLTFDENLLSTTVGALRQALLKDLGAAGPVQEMVVDLTRVTQVDSQGLNLLVGIARECQRRSWSLRATGVAPDLVRLLSYVNLAGLFGLTPVSNPPPA